MDLQNEKVIVVSQSWKGGQSSELIEINDLPIIE